MYSLEPNSFRDPSGFLFYRDDVLYRQINQSYKDDYDHLMASEELVNSKLLILHFCSYFLAPLALMACKDIRLNQLFKN